MNYYGESARIISTVSYPYKSEDKTIRIALELRKRITRELNHDLIPVVDRGYECRMCGSSTHLLHPATKRCFICNL